eukprot:3577159-Pyramimonas_sp.AAC.1
MGRRGHSESPVSSPPRGIASHTRISRGFPQGSRRAQGKDRPAWQAHEAGPNGPNEFLQIRAQEASRLEGPRGIQSCPIPFQDGQDGSEIGPKRPTGELKKSATRGTRKGRKKPTPVNDIRNCRGAGMAGFTVSVLVAERVAADLG